MQSFKYKAIRTRQTESGDWLVLFAASAIEINSWAGIPQKKKIGEQETTGFQREENQQRIKEIANFYKDEKNIIQNPLLCALRQTKQGKVIFKPNDNEDNDHIQHGYLEVIIESLEELNLLELIERVRNNLIARVPTLVNQPISDRLITDLKQRAQMNFDSSEDSEDVLEQDTNSAENGDNNSELSFTDESHISDFYEELTAYVSIMKEIQDRSDKFLDYSKEALISFLRPVVVVDGQHRLRAAIKSAKNLVRETRYKEEIEEAIFNNQASPEDIQREIETKIARRLPISLLMNDDLAEQVFQFVVVNQKATPIKTALLGTIVSTSLSNEELIRVQERLEKSGIKLQESRAVTFLVRYQNSPFLNLVERGLSSDGKDLLKWNVLASIVNIFRELKGGQLFHEKNDYADKWKRDYLCQSKIIENWEAQGYQNPFELWRKLDGAWRDVFIEFWILIRDRLADRDNDQAWHYWGNPKKSNIFNQTSLKILSADFFQYLSDRRLGIDSKEHIHELVEDWLKGVNPNYFNRDWNLHGVKKDVPGIRKRWSTEWVQYRKDPKRLPQDHLYRSPLG
jgi:hypothetical protein